MEELKWRGRSLARVEIDLNSRDRSGHVLARLSAANRRVQSGETVTAFEPDDQVAGLARVMWVDEEHNLISLDVDWTTFADDYLTVDLEVENKTSTSPVQSVVLTYGKVLHNVSAKTKARDAIRKRFRGKVGRKLVPSQILRLSRRYPYSLASFTSATTKVEAQPRLAGPRQVEGTTSVRDQITVKKVVTS
ncbi:hypothetical protein [Micromonospora sp. NPDC049240]|uniref:hypothetical protein n=1 Tax=Micromonospora sp. NPDC049240 TaxID=3155151 RepID=UPI0033DD5E6B